MPLSGQYRQKSTKGSSRYPLPLAGHRRQKYPPYGGKLPPKRGYLLPLLGANGDKKGGIYHPLLVQMGAFAPPLRGTFSPLAPLFCPLCRLPTAPQPAPSRPHAPHALRLRSARATHTRRTAGADAPRRARGAGFAGAIVGSGTRSPSTHTSPSGRVDCARTYPLRY